MQKIFMLLAFVLTTSAQGFFLRSSEAGWRAVPMACNYIYGLGRECTAAITSHETSTILFDLEGNWEAIYGVDGEFEKTDGQVSCKVKRGGRSLELPAGSYKVYIRNWEPILLIN